MAKAGIAKIKCGNSGAVQTDQLANYNDRVDHYNIQQRHSMNNPATVRGGGDARDSGDVARRPLSEEEEEKD